MGERVANHRVWSKACLVKGRMSEVVREGTRRLTDPDRRASATYIRTVPPIRNRSRAAERQSVEERAREGQGGRGLRDDWQPLSGCLHKAWRANWGLFPAAAVCYRPAAVPR